jgi:hypothetical protein
MLRTWWPASAKRTLVRCFNFGGLLNWKPTVDGVYMKELPIKRLLAGKVSQVPSIFGTNEPIARSRS